jgi:putative endonuclease
MFFYTYVLLSQKDHQHYIGFTTDLRRRVEEHRNSKSFATRYRLPLDLIYYEACKDEADAKQREKYLKSTPGRQFLAKRLKNFKLAAAWQRVK